MKRTGPLIRDLAEPSVDDSRVRKSLQQRIKVVGGVALLGLKEIGLRGSPLWITSSGRFR